MLNFESQALDSIGGLPTANESEMRNKKNPWTEHKKKPDPAKFKVVGAWIDRSPSKRRLTELWERQAQVQALWLKWNCNGRSEAQSLAEK